jgi:hypothetical protein
VRGTSRAIVNADQFNVRRKLVKRIRTIIPYLLLTVVGANATYTGFRYMVFSHTKSGFRIPVMNVIVAILFVGVTLMVSTALAFIRPKLSALLAILGLVALAGTLAEQAATQSETPFMVLRQCFGMLVFLALSAVFYVNGVRRKLIPPNQSTDPTAAPGTPPAGQESRHG